jgi:hypothetical protein
VRSSQTAEICSAGVPGRLRAWNLAAVEKAKQHDANLEMTPEEEAAIDQAVNELLMAYHSEDRELIRAHIEKLMINTALGSLKGTKI